jgi:hypothetical protein
VRRSSGSIRSHPGARCTTEYHDPKASPRPGDQQKETAREHRPMGTHHYRGPAQLPSGQQVDRARCLWSNKQGLSPDAAEPVPERSHPEPLTFSVAPPPPPLGLSGPGGVRLAPPPGSPRAHKMASRRERERERGGGGGGMSEIEARGRVVGSAWPRAAALHFGGAPCPSRTQWQNGRWQSAMATTGNGNGQQLTDKEPTRIA